MHGLLKYYKAAPHCDGDSAQAGAAGPPGTGRGAAGVGDAAAGTRVQLDKAARTPWLFRLTVRGIGVDDGGGADCGGAGSGSGAESEDAEDWSAGRPARPAGAGANVAGRREWQRHATGRGAGDRQRCDKSNDE